MRRYIGIAVLALAELTGCGGSSYGPSSPDTGRGGGGGGSAGSVSIGAGIQFVSGHNGSMNPAVDTIVAGATVTWTWKGTLPHSVKSVGTPSFASSDTRTGSGTYAVTFNTPGTYRYECAVHGQAMTGTIVVAGPAASLSQSVTDPTGDMFGSADVKWDLTALTVARDTSGLTVLLDFSRDVVAAVGRDSAAMYGVVDLDLDQNPATGGVPVTDEFRLDGRTATVGVDAYIDLYHPGPDSSRVLVLDAQRHPVGLATAEYAGRRVTLRVPRALIGNDDGLVNAAAIVGSLASPSDFAPDTGHLTLGAASQLVAGGVTVGPRRVPAPRTWGSM